MAILKSEIRNKFTSIPNEVIQNNELSDGDFRLLIFLYSLPDKWKINQGYLAQKMNCNRVNVNKKLRRIKESGYLEIVKPDLKNNETDYIYILKENEGVSSSDVSMKDMSMKDVSPSDTHINNNIIKTNINKNLVVDRNNKDIVEENLFEFTEKIFGRPLSPTEIEMINQWENTDLTRYAIKQSELAQARNVKYVNRILFEYKKCGIKSVVEAEERDKRFQERKSGKFKAEKKIQEYEVGKVYEVDGIKFKYNEDGKREIL